MKIQWFPGHMTKAFRMIEKEIKVVRTGVKQVILSHLSEENNTPELAYLTIKNILLQHGIEEGKHIFVDVAMQHTVGNIFEI